MSEFYSKWACTMPGVTAPVETVAGIESLLSRLSNIFDISDGSKLFRAFLGALTRAINDTRIKRIDTINQFSVQAASGAYLDEHGKFYSVSRYAGESDDEYRQRILANIGRFYGTRKSVEDAIAVFVARDKIVIYEFGRDLWVLGVSQLGVDTILRDTPLGPFTFEVVIFDGVSFSDRVKQNIQRAIDMAKMAGTSYTISYVA